MGKPHFFVDRSLGRVRVPTLLRNDDWVLTTLAEHYGIPNDQDVADTEWLGLAGRQRWPVLMKDARIRYRPAERQAFIEHGVRAFCLTSGNLTSSDMADLYLSHRDEIWRQADGEGPALFVISRHAMREVMMDE